MSKDSKLSTSQIAYGVKTVCAAVTVVYVFNIVYGRMLEIGNTLLGEEGIHIILQAYYEGKINAEKATASTKGGAKDFKNLSRPPKVFAPPKVIARGFHQRWWRVEGFFLLQYTVLNLLTTRDRHHLWWRRTPKVATGGNHLWLPPEVEGWL